MDSPCPHSVLSRLFDAGRPPKGAAPQSRPRRHRDDPPRQGAARAVPPTADGFDWDPVPSPSSQSFSPVTDPFCRLPLPTLFHRPEDRLTHVQVPLTWNLSPSPSKFSFEYLLLPPRSDRRPPRQCSRPRGFHGQPPSLLLIEALAVAPTAELKTPAPAIPRETSREPATRCPLGDPANQLPLRLYGFGRPHDSHTCRLLGPFFKTGRMGSPLADAKSAEVPRGARPRRSLPTLLGHRRRSAGGSSAWLVASRPAAEGRFRLQLNGRKAADSHTLALPGSPPATRGILGPGRAEPPLSGRRPWGKVFFSQPRQGGARTTNLLADDDDRTAARWGAAGHGWGEHAGADASVAEPRYPLSRVAVRLPCSRSDRHDRLASSFAWHRSPESGCSWCSPPDRRWSPTLSPPAPVANAEARGFDGRCDWPPPAAAGHRGAARSLGRFRFRGIDNDPSAGSVDFSQTHIGGRTANAATDPNTSPTIQSVGSDGRCVQRAGIVVNAEADDSRLTRNSSLKTNNCNDLSPSMMKFSKITRPVRQGYRLAEYISCRRARPVTSKGITPVIASNFRGLNGHSPSKKLAGRVTST
ncbi:hypothetical protein H6P81_021714 [Aristolochia fimbriata]|uniref:Uncharacterized protein n=1 Tax=Aristolochia fimbriata TaxID=158543 RepID=A0AAV7DSY0_ARIFI|nr:hypothetical protein H6P81_021714 [Aristolochia fimbriata]